MCGALDCYCLFPTCASPSPLTHVPWLCPMAASHLIILFSLTTVPQAPVLYLNRLELKAISSIHAPSYPIFLTNSRSICNALVERVADAAADGRTRRIERRSIHRVRPSARLNFPKLAIQTELLGKPQPSGSACRVGLPRSSAVRQGGARSGGPQSGRQGRFQSHNPAAADCSLRPRTCARRCIRWLAVLGVGTGARSFAGPQISAAATQGPCSSRATFAGTNQKATPCCNASALHCHGPNQCFGSCRMQKVHIDFVRLGVQSEQRRSLLEVCNLGPTLT
jgi:hypothetical protein